MKKLPSGVQEYEKIIRDGYYYVDKTQYIEKLEELSNSNIMYLRPRKFGKTLLTSVLENYYDINKKEQFEELFGNTYIGKSPTPRKNSYHILRFNFSGVSTEKPESTIADFKYEVLSSIKAFIKKYKVNYEVDENKSAEAVTNEFFKMYEIDQPNQKIYVIIDEYDHFANELLGFKFSEFKNLVTENGKVRKWYEVLKNAAGRVIDRIFITGVAPITLDSLTSGFNIATDITKDRRFNEMTGFTEEELIQLMKDQNLSEEEINKLLPIMKENYNGYKFSMDGKQKVYNSNMCLFFMDQYIDFKEMPKELEDPNIASDYSKLGGMLKICDTKNKVEIIRKTITGEPIVSELTTKFNPELGFGEKELISMLYYLGYLTIEGEKLGRPILKIPNYMMRQLYGKYFLDLMSELAKFKINAEQYDKMQEEIALEGKIDEICKILEIYLGKLSNRDYLVMEEKHVQVMLFSIAMNLELYIVKTEYETEKKYIDIVMSPIENNGKYHTIIIELKYLKKSEASLLEAKKKEAKEQIEKYANTEEFKNTKKLDKYTVVAINDKLYIDKIE